MISLNFLIFPTTLPLLTFLSSIQKDIVPKACDTFVMDMHFARIWTQDY